MNQENITTFEKENLHQTQNVIPPVRSGFVQKYISPVYQKTDSFMKKFIPNEKFRKVSVFSFLGLLIFFVFILFLAMIMSLSGIKKDSGYFLKKTNITNSSLTPKKEQTENQKIINTFKEQLNSLNFPPHEITIPDLSIGVDIKEYLKND